jgi:hypothetical protein
VPSFKAIAGIEMLGKGLNLREWKSEQLRLLKHGNLLENGQLSLAARDGEFSAEQRDYVRNREVNLDIIKKKLTSFKLGLKNILDRLKAVKEGNHAVYNPADLQKYLESFETKLTSYKSTMRAEFDGLESEGLRLDEDLQNMTTKIIEWEVQDMVKPGIHPQLAPRDGEISDDQRMRVADRYEKHVELQSKIGIIDRQLANLGGRYGGWESRDHDSFIRSWVQCTSTSQTVLSDAQRKTVLKKLIANVPLKTEEELMEHMEWYVKFSELSANKKSLIEEWKISRQRELKKKFKTTLDDSLLDQSSVSKDKERVDAPGAIPKEDREAQRQRIATWKKDREEVQRLEEAAQHEAQLLEEQRKEREKRKRQQQAQLKLDLWKKEEEAATETLKKTERVVKSQSARVTASELAARQKRDREMTQLQLARKEAAQEKAVAREAKVRELAELVQVVGAGPDPERVRNATKAFRQHQNEAESLAEAAKRRASASAHRSVIAGAGRDLQGVGRQAPAWMSMKG